MNTSDHETERKETHESGKHFKFGEVVHKMSD